jgi:hypothetical protein
MKKDEPQEPMSKGFDALLGDLDDGSVVVGIDQELQSLMQQTLSVAKSKGQAGQAVGTLDIKLTFKVDASGEVESRASHSIKAPTIASALTRRWLDPKTATIIEVNPRQTSLPLKDVLPPPAELRSL